MGRRYQQLKFFTDYYTENQAEYYASKRRVCLSGSETVQVGIQSGAPAFGAPQLVSRPQDLWQQRRKCGSRRIPMLSNSTNTSAGSSHHRPLFVQTASLGPIDIHQRMDLTQNPDKPSPVGRGVRLISAATMRSQKCAK